MKLLRLAGATTDLFTKKQVSCKKGFSLLRKLRLLSKSYSRTNGSITNVSEQKVPVQIVPVKIIPEQMVPEQIVPVQMVPVQVIPV